MTYPTPVGRGRPAARRALLALTTALVSTLASPAFAQADPVPPPSRYVLDANGVNLATGKFQVNTTELSIGSGASALSVDQVRGIGVSGISYEQRVYQNGVNWSASIPTSDGGRSYTFTRSGSTFTSNTGEGATLVLSGPGYLLTLADGTQYTFGETRAASGDGTTAKARLSQIKLATGELLNIVYATTSYCSTNLDSCNTYITRLRLQSVTSSYGYQLHYNYAANEADTRSLGASWSRLTQIVAINLAVDYCDPQAAACTTSRAWPQVSYSTAQSGNVSTTTVTDAIGRATRYTTDATPGAAKFSIKRASSSTDNTVVSYDANGLVSSAATDGRTWTYAFSLSGNLRTAVVTNPDQTSRTIVSDTTVGLPVSVKDELNHTTSYHYDASGRLDKATAPEGNYVAYEYDARGNPTKTRLVSKTPGSDAEIVTTAQYPDTCSNAMTCNKPIWTKDANQNRRTAQAPDLDRTDYTYDTTHGGVLTVTAAAPTSGAVRPEVRYGYSPLQAYYKNASGSIVASGATVYRLISTSACQTQASCAGTHDEVKTTIGYGAQATGTANNLLPVSVTTGAGDGSPATTTTATYDAVGNLTTVDGPLPGAADTTTSIYDAARQITITVGPDPDGAGVLKNRAVSIHYTADGLADQQSVGNANADGSGFTALQVAAAAYDASDRVTRTEARDGSGNVYALTQYSYDAIGRQECAAVRMNSAAWGSLPVSACTAQGVGTANADRVTKLTYDATGQITKTTSAYGTSDASDDANGTYSVNGKLQTLTDAKGNVTAYEYDGFDRLRKTRYPNASGGGSSTVDYEQLSYDANGNVTSRRLRDGSGIGYGYDALSRLTSKDLPGSELDVTYGYDLLSRPTQAQTSAQTLSFGYDALGRNLTQAGPLGTIAVQYDAAGRRTRLSWPDAFYVTYDYLVTGEMTAIREQGATAGAGVLATFGYDDLGRRTNLSRGNGTSTSYAFDPVSRLSALGQDLAGSGNDLSVGFTYNPAGQITAATRSNDAYVWNGHYNRSTPYGINGLNQASSAEGTAIGYDARGNVTAIGASAYTYSAENLQLTGPSSASLIHDPLARLYQTGQAGGTRFLYDGLEMTGEYDTNNVLQRRYVFGPGTDEPLIWYEGAGTGDKRWLHADERGSVIAVSNSAGTTLAANSYDEYGAPALNNLGRFGYTGQVWLPEMGLWYYKARMYTPKLGRFMQTDPIGYADGTNWYNYVGGDPVNFTDPMGLDFCPGTTDWCSSGSRQNGSPFPFEALRFGGSAGFYANERNDAVDDGPDIVVNAVRPRKKKIIPGAAVPQKKQCFGPPAAPGTGASPSELANQARNNAAQAGSRYYNPLNIFWFRSQVQNKGPWDYKQYSRGFQDFGNYNYGRTGAAMGLATDFLLGQAGRAQQAAGTSKPEWGNPGFLGYGDLGGAGSYGDDPRDQEMIKRGISDQRNGC